ncbi:MAG: GNAT family N-acetyltransferase [Chloroflexi bacterium]|nr:GNAT family N-acetyltransferase [Chloroflexota bacterium]
MLDIEIVRAHPKDSPRLKQIAIDSKRHWGYPEHLVSKWAQTPIITPESIDIDKVHLARVGSLTVGWVRLLIRLPDVVLEDLWVLPDFIGKGIGKRLFGHVLEQAKLSGARHLELDADPHAQSFYVKMGCRVVSESVSEWGRNIPHMVYNLQG